MKKMRGLLCFLLVCCLTFGFAGQILAANEVETTLLEDGRVQVVLEFDDIEDAEWASGYITKMQSKNVFQGFEDGTFRPNQPIPRVQAIVTAVRLMGLENEAKVKSPDTKLHFKDADLLDRKFSWAEGYVIVALEHGLFDATEDRIQPDKPASRVWVSSLLVKSLGLQAKALQQMTKTPDFTDASQIPAGAVGYINVAVEHGIVSGYSDGTFKPNKNVTRAEMAALLDRTNSGLLENAGAVKVSGTVKDIHFNNASVTDSVYGSVNGQISIVTLDKEPLSYGISSELLVEYRNKFIQADQLAVNDAVSLVVQEDTVIDAKLLDPKETKNKDDGDESDLDNSVVGIVEFEFEAELTGKEKIKLEYQNEKGKKKAKVEKKSKEDKEKLQGEEAVDFIENLLAEAGLSENMNKNEAADEILSALNIDKDNLKKLELKVKYSNGKEMKVEIEHDEDEDEDEDDDDD